jgi:hypothetical protein
MEESLTFENTTAVNMISYEPRVAGVQCTVGKVPFQAEFSIHMVPGLSLLEFVAFEDWLRYVAQQRSYIIEELTDVVYDKLVEALEPRALLVQCRAETRAHAPVTVTRGDLIVGGEQ